MTANETTARPGPGPLATLTLPLDDGRTLADVRLIDPATPGGSHGVLEEAKAFLERK